MTSVKPPKYSISNKNSNIRTKKEEKAEKLSNSEGAMKSQ